MSRLFLRFLGPPTITLGGKAVDIRRRKVLALLAYLAVTAQPKSRDFLAELLFTRQDRQRARSDLRQCLSLLGTAIGADYLRSTRLQVELARSRDLSVDVATYRGLLEEGRAASQSGDLDGARERLGEAAALFRGEFLDGLYLKDCPGFEDWQLQEQELLRAAQASALGRLVEIHEARAEYDPAIDFCRRRLDLEPLEESVHRDLMRLYSRSGRRPEALRQYEKCRDILGKELGEKPGEETERLRVLIAAPGLAAADRFLRGRDRDSAVSLRQQPQRSGPLFLFCRFEGPAEQAAQIEARSRDIVLRSHGSMIDLSDGTLCASFTTASAAVATAISVEGSAHIFDAGIRCVVAADEDALRADVPSEAMIARAGLLLDISHAGQVLVNDAAARLCRVGGLPGGAALRTLGAHRLADLGPAAVVHQVEHPTLPVEYPRLESLDSRPNNLPTQPSTFIGREQELATVRDLLVSEETRLATLTGAGGAGKTRLALQGAASAVQRFEHGAFFIDLSPLREPPQVARAIASTLGVREIGGNGRSLVDALLDYLRAKQMLLLLDTFEHLLPAADLVADLLSSSPGLKVLATSREALRLRSERVMSVPPMRLPSRGQRWDTIQRSEAVRLFVLRAAAAAPGFALDAHNAEAIAEICIRLDGLPLAIELAAAQISHLSPRELLARLEGRMRFPTEGPRDLPERQRTLRSEVDWSHELLREDERRVFRRLSVFAAGCTLEAAKAVCFADGENDDPMPCLASLVDKSLLMRRESDAGTRFRMLDSIREYARDRLQESRELEVVGARFFSWARHLAEKAEPLLYGPEHERWFATVEAEYANISTALAGLRDRGAIEDGLRLAGALGWFWFRRARFTEGEYWLELFRSAAAAGVPPGPRAKAAYYLGWMKLCVGSAYWGNPEGKRLFAESLSLWRQTGNAQGIALSQVWLGWNEGDAEGADGWALADQSVAIARETGNPWTIAWCLKVAYSHLRRGDKDLGARRAALEEAIALAREAGDPFLLCQTMNGMGNVFAWVGDLAAARPWYREALQIARELGDSWSILDTLNVCADSCLGLGEITEAKRLFSEGLRLAAELGTRAYLAWFIGGLYGVAKREGRMTRAARLGAASESILGSVVRCDPGFAAELGLDPEAAAAQWDIGQSMTLEQAVAYALADA